MFDLRGGPHGQAVILQRGQAVVLAQRGVRPELQQRPRGRSGLAVLCRVVQRSVAALVLRVEVRAVGAAQRPDELHLVADGRIMQGGVAVPVRPVHVRALGRQQLDGGPRGALDCGQLRRRTAGGTSRLRRHPDGTRSFFAFGSRPARSSSLRASHFLSHASWPSGSLISPRARWEDRLTARGSMTMLGLPADYEYLAM